MVHFESNTHKKNKKFSGRIFNFCFLLQDRSVQSFFFSFFKYILGLVKYTKRKERKKRSGLHSHRLFFDSMCSVQVCKIKIVISKITNNNENKKNKQTKERKAVERDFYKKKISVLKIQIVYLPFENLEIILPIGVTS